MTDRTFGVEIELSRYTNVQRERFVQRGDWRAKEDGSLRGNFCAELESPILKGNSGLGQVRELFQGLTKDGFTLAANESCGLHVHVGLQDVGRENVHKIWQMVANVEPLLFAMVNETRKGNQYCSPVTGNPFFADGWATFNAVFQGAQTAYHHHANRLSKIQALRHSPTRYAAVNMLDYYKRQCVEFRLHHGTHSGRTICNWTSFCVDLIDLFYEYGIKENNAIPALARTSIFPDNSTDLANRILFLQEIGASKQIISYINRRIDMFSNPPPSLFEKQIKIVTEDHVTPWDSVTLTVGADEALSKEKPRIKAVLLDNELIIAPEATSHRDLRGSIVKVMEKKMKNMLQTVIDEFERDMPSYARTNQVPHESVEVGALVVINPADTNHDSLTRGITSAKLSNGNWLVIGETGARHECREEDLYMLRGPSYGGTLINGANTTYSGGVDSSHYAYLSA